MRKLALAVVAAIALFSSTGCRIGAGGEDFPYRGWKHIEWHFLKFYKQLVKFHVEVDRFIFDLDEEDPDNY